ncbi:MAG: hypothetical protein LIP12_13285 [Clostridiales bacterium]|nr:hypothetical protein [Clostridiales bacterium]
MLNSDYKKQAIAEAQRAKDTHQKTYDNLIEHAGDLKYQKDESLKILQEVHSLFSWIVGLPKEMQDILAMIEMRVKNYEKEINDLTVESENINVVSGTVAGAGAAAGVGVAALGPTAAMAVATTFGTASTGTAIATLSGAAATNAALAWLGGGALAAGGGGMAAGEFLLTMAGPVGWGIAGAALVGGGLMANSKNKKIAEKAERQTREIKKETEKLKELDVKVVSEKKAVEEIRSNTTRLIEGKEIRKLFQEMRAQQKMPGISFPKLKQMQGKKLKSCSQETQQELLALLNVSNALSKRLEVKIE